MTTAYIQDIIPARMAEMGFGERYRVEHRTAYLPGNARVTIRAWNAWVWLPSEAFTPLMRVSVESNFGCLDNMATDLTKRQHEHTGRITVKNLDSIGTFLTMIVATPHP